MISEKYLKENIVVSLIQLHSKKTKLPVFAIASAVPVMIRWKDNTSQQIDLMDRIPIEMKMVSRMRYMVGKVLTSRDAEKYITSELLRELTFKTYAGIKEREEMGYLPDRLKPEEKKYIKNIYEVKKRSAKV